MANIRAVQKALDALGIGKLEARPWRRSVVLEGRVRTWQDYIRAGYAAAGKGFKGVVNDIEVEGLEREREYIPPVRDNTLEGKQFDVIVIGGGVIGCAIARELTRWQLRVAVLEKEDDVAKQTSSRNNGMIHPGIAPARGTKKLHYNILGNRMYTQAARELGFALERCGSLILLEKSWYRLLAPLAKQQALQKGVDGVILLSRREVFRREPYATPAQRGGVLLPSAGVVAPYDVTVAFAENAVENGAQVFLHTMVQGFAMEHDRIARVLTNRGRIRAKVVVNAAGVWADKVAGWANDRFFTIHGRKGTIAILDKKTRAYQSGVLAMPRLAARPTPRAGALTPPWKAIYSWGPTPWRCRGGKTGPRGRRTWSSCCPGTCPSTPGCGRGTSSLTLPECGPAPLKKISSSSRRSTSPTWCMRRESSRRDWPPLRPSPGMWRRWR